MNVAPSGGGGGISTATGTTGAATLTVENSAFTGNTANTGGGLLNIDGMTTIKNSTFSGNKAQDGGVLFNFSSGDVKIENSTFTQNVADMDGGAIAQDLNSTLEIVNSTFSGNRAGQNGGGIFNTTNSLVTISFSTITLNEAIDFGGGLYNETGAEMEVKNSIVAKNTVDDCANGGIFTARGIDYDSDGTCAIIHDTFMTATANQLNLGLLADNGGPTQTHALLPGSVAIDAITDCTDFGLDLIDEDQRERARAFPFDGLCDVGAYEFRYEFFETRSRGSLGFNVNVKCGERQEMYMLNSTPFTSIVEYNTNIEIIFPLTRTSANPITADIIKLFNLIEPAGYLAAGQRTLPVQAQLQGGGAYHIDCAGIRTFPSSVNNDADPDQPEVDELLKAVVGRGAFFRGILGIETSERNLKVFATTTERVLRCIGDPIDDNCFETGVNNTRVEIESERISNSRTEVFTQSFKSQLKVFESGHAIQFTAQATGLTEMGVEIYGLNGQRVFSATSPNNSLVWHMRDGANRAVANGVYLYVVTARDAHGNVVRSGVKKLLVMR